MKLLVIAIVVVFLGWWMVQAPNELASFASDGAGWTWDTAQTLFGAVADFLSALFR